MRTISEIENVVFRKWGLSLSLSPLSLHTHKIKWVDLHIMHIWEFSHIQLFRPSRESIQSNQSIINVLGISFNLQYFLFVCYLLPELKTQSVWYNFLFKVVNKLLMYYWCVSAEIVFILFDFFRKKSNRLNNSKTIFFVRISQIWTIQLLFSLQKKKKKKRRRLLYPSGHFSEEDQPLAAILENVFPHYGYHIYHCGASLLPPLPCSFSLLCHIDFQRWFNLVGPGAVTVGKYKKF